MPGRSALIGVDTSGGVPTRDAPGKRRLCGCPAREAGRRGAQRPLRRPPQPLLCCRRSAESPAERAYRAGSPVTFGRASRTAITAGPRSAESGVPRKVTSHFAAFRVRPTAERACAKRVQVGGDCGSWAGDSPVVQVPHIQWRRHRPGAGIDGEGERGRSQRIALLDTTRRRDCLTSDDEWSGRTVGLVGQVVHFGAALSDAGQEDITPHGVECVGDVDLDQHISGIRITAGLDEASCTVERRLHSRGAFLPRAGWGGARPRGWTPGDGHRCGMPVVDKHYQQRLAAVRRSSFLGRTAMRRRRRPCCSLAPCQTAPGLSVLSRTLEGGGRTQLPRWRSVGAGEVV